MPNVSLIILFILQRKFYRRIAVKHDICIFKTSVLPLETYMNRVKILFIKKFYIKVVYKIKVTNVYNFCIYYCALKYRSCRNWMDFFNCVTWDKIK